MMLDFRSDTVTQPTREMRLAMAQAEVGDDVYGDDPTVNELQKYACQLLGCEAALYVPSGTMGNLLAIMSSCSRGDGVLMGVNSHTWMNEGGGAAFLAGVMPFPLDDASGLPGAEEVTAAFIPEGNDHHAPTKLLTLENTHNAAGGMAISPAQFREPARAARALGMKVHLDGARIFNACEYYEVDVKEYVSEVDSVQFCLSKGLSAPLGSLLCGTRPFIEKARRYRKVLGGGQRQLGVAAAAGIVALKEMRSRLKEDHRNAAILADALTEAGVAVEPVSARTNMVHFSLPEGEGRADAFVVSCAKRGLLLGASGPKRIRLVTHLGLDEQAARDAAAIVGEVLSA